ncbi:GNAT family N-acetyltransferase [Aurantivibrio plasticivorans]
MEFQPFLYSSELLLRPFSLADAGAVQVLAGDKRVAETTSNIPHPYLDGFAESWIATHEGRWQRAEGVTYAITLKNDEMLIGAIGLLGISGSSAEIGYWIGVPFWGQGYCTQAVACLVGFGFSELNLERIYAKHLTINPASGKVLAKCSFTHIGQTVENRSKDNSVVTVEQYEKFKA